MKKLILVPIIFILALVNVLAQEIFTTANGKVSFYAEASITDVDATNEKTKIELNTATNEVSVTIAMSDFKFKSSKMGRDAEKKYLETKKFPKASFKGKINGDVNYQKPGSYNVTAAGKMNIHGVEKQVNQKGTVTVSKEQITLQSEFDVELKDYKIETPKILGKEMTSETVKIKINASLKGQPKKSSPK